MPSLFTRPTLSIRIHAGFNASSVLAGLLYFCTNPLLTPAQLLSEKFPTLEGSLELAPRCVHQISGVCARLALPPEHAHRTLSDIARVYDSSTLSPAARAKADAVWDTLGRAEARVHGMTLEDVHFHEVGRMANIVAIGLIAELITVLDPEQLVVSPIPVGDGEIRCAHGLVPNPAPALFAMLDAVPVRHFSGEGEAVTPTGLAVLKGLGARFGGWPSMCVQAHTTVFLPDRQFDSVPNGALFALGTSAA